MTDDHESQTPWSFQDIAIEWYVRNHFLQSLPRWGWHNKNMASFFAPQVIWHARDVREKAIDWVGERYVHPRYNHDPDIDDHEHEPVTLSKASMDQFFPRYEGTQEDLAIELIRYAQMLLEHSFTRDGGHMAIRISREIADLRAAGRILVETREDEGILACCAIPSTSPPMPLSVFPLVLERAWRKPSSFGHRYQRGPSRVYFLLRNAAVLQDIIGQWKVPN